MNRNFSKYVCIAIDLAKLEAQKLRHEYIGTEHLLLGLIREGSSIQISIILGEYGITLDNARAEVKKLNSNVQTCIPGGMFPETPRCKRVLERAEEISQEQGDENVEIEHLFYSLVYDSEDLSAQALANLGFQKQGLEKKLFN
jgi:ATP-dependent Clp protease ATP-binding subunit ClpC